MKLHDLISAIGTGFGFGFLILFSCLLGCEMVGEVETEIVWQSTWKTRTLCAQAEDFRIEQAAIKARGN
jgi:hypothetical protein